MIGVHLNQLPLGGMHLAGDESPGFLDLEAISAKPAGPVHYELEVGLSGGGVFATGRVAAPVEMTCVACLQPFVFQAVSDPFAAQVQLDGRELVDLTPAVREELLLALPNHPRCDQLPDHRCPYHAPETSGGGEPEKVPSAWDKLEKLKTKR
jgi:uncharacterized protein